MDSDDDQFAKQGGEALDIEDDLGSDDGEYDEEEDEPTQ